jgi:hypothetical protein
LRLYLAKKCVVAQFHAKAAEIFRKEPQRHIKQAKGAKADFVHERLGKFLESK